MTEPKKPEVGDRVRVVKDLATEDGRVYIHKGTIGIVDTIDEDSPPLMLTYADGEEWVYFEDVEVVAPAAEVAQEPLKFAVTATIKVEIEVTVEGDNHRDAIEHFEAHALDYLDDYDSLELKKVKITDIHAEDQY